MESMRIGVLVIAIVTVLSLSPRSLAAQHAGGADSSQNRGVEAGACYGFSFGTWNPPLDWQKAGHPPIADSLKNVHPAAGRDWAAPTPEQGAIQLIVYPSWWLAGVSVEFLGAAPARSDTVPAKATALVADGRVKSPTAPARAWRVACRT